MDFTSGVRSARFSSVEGQPVIGPGNSLAFFALSTEFAVGIRDFRVDEWGFCVAIGTPVELPPNSLPSDAEYPGVHWAASNNFSSS